MRTCIQRLDPDVLTVSQKPEGGGTYRTLKQALGAAKAGQTIRVLDDAVYEEALDALSLLKFFPSSIGARAEIAILIEKMCSTGGVSGSAGPHSQRQNDPNFTPIHPDWRGRRACFL